MPDVVAFFSYSHFDDEHDRADLSRLRERFEGELRAQSGTDIAVFHDRRDIHWGQAWKRRIDEAIETTAFLVPIITPNFLGSPECRRELESFHDREQRLSRDDLILPIYYIEVPALESRSAADDPLAKLLKARQYVDWRRLRHKSLNSAKGRESVSELGRRFLAAVQRLHRVSVPEEAPRRESPPRVVVATSDDELLAQLVDGDPLIAFHAASVIAERPDLLPRIVDLGVGTPIGSMAVRVVMRRHPKAAADVLMPRIENAGRQWHAASRVTSYFDPALAPFCEGTLGDFVKRGDIDRQRLSIEALGYCGSYGWAYQLRERIEGDDSYSLQKLGSYVLEALARFVVRSPDEGGSDGVRYTTDAFREEFTHLKKESRSSISWLTLLRILLECDGRHADAFIGWLDAPSKSIANLGAELLGYLRIVRAVRRIARLFESSSDDSSRRYYAEALARIGTPSALQPLLGAGQGGSALAFAVDDIADSDSFDRVAESLLVEAGALSYLAIRAVGRRPTSRLGKPVAAALESEDALTRGCAVLALARRGAIDERRVRVAREQAADHQEHLLSTLGLLVLVPTAYPEVEQGLRTRLAKDSFLWFPQLQFDVLDVLRAAKRPDATALANAWRPFYRLAELQA